MSQPYVLLTRPGVVELWSAVRLPYEPSGWLLEMRDHLQLALDDLSNTSSGQLHAIYRAADDSAFVDTENVLLYNVRGKALGKLTRHSLTVERGYRVPPPPPSAGFQDGQALHYHRYSEAGEVTDRLWKPGQSLGEFAEISVDAVDKPAPIWKAIRESANPPNQTASAPMRFHIDVEITDTRPSPVGSVNSVIKSVLDGIISAYHSHDKRELIPDASRLEAMGLGTPQELRTELLNPRWSALGARRLLRPHGASGVQWNPADDFCVSADVSLYAGGAASHGHAAALRLTAKLSEAVPRQRGSNSSLLASESTYSTADESAGPHGPVGQPQPHA